MMKKLTIDDKLGCDLYNTDEHESHIDVDLECKDEAALRMQKPMPFLSARSGRMHQTR